MGGAIGIQICGFVFTWEIARQVSAGMAKLGKKSAAMADLSTLELDKLTADQQQVVRDAYAGALGDIFVPLLVLSLIGLVCVCLMKGSELISEYAEHEAQRHQATERERELVRRALEKDQVSREIAQLKEQKDSAEPREESASKGEIRDDPPEGENDLGTDIDRLG